MPGLRSVLKDPTVLDDGPDIVAESVQLWMPSELPIEDRRRACAEGLADVEARVREATAFDSLDDLRRNLFTRTYVNKWRGKNVSGQRRSTRARTLQHNVDMKVHEAKTRYRASRHALLALRGGGIWENALKELRDDDVRALNERSMTDQEREQREHRVRTGTEVADDARDGVFIQGTRGEGKRTVSWIWMTVSKDDDSPEMIQGEYCSIHHLHAPLTIHI